jgi:DNA polymerase-1
MESGSLLPIEQPFDSVLIEDNPNNIMSLIDTIANTGECAIDTETDGLHWAIGNKPFMATFCAEDSTAWATYDPDVCFQIMDFIQRNKLSLIMHNAKFDLHMIRQWNAWEPSSYFGVNLNDTMQGFRILHNDRSAALKSAAGIYIPQEQLDITAPQKAVMDWIAANATRERVNGKWVVTKPGFHEVPRHTMLPYAVQDAWMTLKCWHGLQRDAADKEKQWNLYKTEIELTKLLLHMEKHGWHIDMEQLLYRIQQASGELKTALDALEVIKPGILVSSPKQLAELFYDDMEEQVKFTTKTGRKATNDAALINMENAETAMVVRSARKWKKALDKCNELGRFMAPSGGCHSDFKQDRARTGRFGSAAPNLQNLPRPGKEEYTLCRDVFRPETGFEWLLADYSQIEMCIFAHYCQDEYLLAAIRDGVDLHALTASRIYGVSVEELMATMKKNRTFGKLLNFTIIYGGGRNKITKALLYGSAQNEPLELEEARQALLLLRPYASDKQIHMPHQYVAEELLRSYRREFPGATEFMTQVQNTIRYRHKHEGRGYVKNMFGRVTPVDFERAYAGTNYIVQGTAADLMKAAMVKVWHATEQWAGENSLVPWIDVALFATVHDEIIFKVPVGMADSLARHINGPLTDWPAFTVPIKAEYALVKEGSSWARKEDLKLV